MKMKINQNLLDAVRVIFRGKLILLNALEKKNIHFIYDSSVDKEPTCTAGGLPGSITGLGRSAGEGTGYPLQYFGLENSIDCIVHGVAKSQTPLSDFTHKDLLCSTGNSTQHSVMNLSDSFPT